MCDPLEQTISGKFWSLSVCVGVSQVERSKVERSLEEGAGGKRDMLKYMVSHLAF